MIDGDHLPAPRLPSNVRQWAMFCHLAAFAGLVFPFGNLLGPLIVWQLKKDLDPYIDHHGKEAMNFQITFTFATLICYLLVFLLVGFLMIPALMVAAAVLVVIAAIKANDGVSYRYPFTWRPVS